MSKRASRTGGAAVLLAMATAVAWGQDSGSFEAALRQVEAAQVELVRGHPEPFKQLWSRGEDVTLVGGLGGQIERGWAGVARRLDWVSTQYSEGSRDHEEVSRMVGQEMAYVVQRETIRFRVPNQNREVTQVLRATMVFRREGGVWRIVHRHADSQTVRERTL